MTILQQARLTQASRRTKRICQCLVTKVPRIYAGLYLECLNLAGRASVRQICFHQLRYPGRILSRGNQTMKDNWYLVILPNQSSKQGRIIGTWSSYPIKQQMIGNTTAQRGARTHDPEIKSLMLYRLSQPGLLACFCVLSPNQKNIVEPSDSAFLKTNFVSKDKETLFLSRHRSVISQHISKYTWQSYFL